MLTIINRFGCFITEEKNNFVKVLGPISSFTASDTIGWAQGVDFYIVEKQNEDGSWQFFKKVDGSLNSTFDVK